ncbi:MAG: cupin [Anaerolinea sp. 4484_236]|nr:MAG: cupin [Anaerolinea sp. 4484_236]
MKEWVFNLHDPSMGIPRRLAEGIQARVFAGEQAMLSVVRFEPNSVGKMHSHPEEQWGVLLEGECARLQGDEEIEVKAGDFWHTPGGVPHAIRVGEKGALVLDIFSPPRPEYKQAGAGFGEAKAQE